MHLFHSSPTDKAINIIHKKSRKADNYGKIRNIFYGRQNPQHNQNDIIRRIGKRIKGASAKHHTRRKKARRNGKRAGNQIRGIRPKQDKIKQSCYTRSQKQGTNHFLALDFMNRNLIFLIRMANP